MKALLALVVVAFAGQLKIQLPGGGERVLLLHRPNPKVVAWCRVCEREYNYYSDKP